MSQKEFTDNKKETTDTIGLLTQQVNTLSKNLETKEMENKNLLQEMAKYKLQIQNLEEKVKVSTAVFFFSFFNFHQH